MDLGSLFLIFSLAILVGLFISRPFFDRSRTERTASVVSSEGKQEHALSALLAERDRVLNTLQELDFDHAVGKIPEEDYPAQRAALVNRGAEVLRQVDILQETGLAGGLSSAPIEEHAARLEAAVAGRREKTAVLAGAHSNGRRTPAGAADDPLEAQIAARRRARQEKAAGFCTQCGSPVQKSDLFCPKCGTKLKRET